MAQPYSQTREVHLKLVFYGPALAGKTSTLQYLYKVLRPDLRGQLVSVNTGADRTQFFDFFPAPPSRMPGISIHMQIYAASGSVQNEATRRALLAGTDGILFIADSQRGRERDNISALEELRNCLLDLNQKLLETPLVLAWNKRDLPNVISVGELDAGLNINQSPSFATVAQSGQGVFEAFRILAARALDEAIKRRPELQPSNFGSKLDAAYASDMVTNRRLLATQEAQRALLTQSRRYPGDDRPSPSEAAQRSGSAAPPLSPAPSAPSIPSPAAPAAVSGEAAALPEPPHSVHPPSAAPPVSFSSSPPPGATEQPVEPTIPMHVLPVRGETQTVTMPLVEDPLGLRSRASGSGLRARIEPPIESPTALNSGRSGGQAAPLASRTSQRSRPTQSSIAARVEPAREVFMSQLLPPGSLRTQLQDVERLLHAGQHTPAVRRAAGIFYALTAADATREPDEGPAWRGLVLGLPVDRYLRFRQAVQDAESGKSTPEDGLFALFFLLDALLRKEAGLARAT